ncbi:hypothetical protein LC1Hm_0057 [Halomicrobium sp. LC1Hm]|nr:hypothetical protein LC1Hm_0057 [Halomicrobium sp. LC1Hm]
MQLRSRGSLRASLRCGAYREGLRPSVRANGSAVRRRRRGSRKGRQVLPAGYNVTAEPSSVSRAFGGVLILPAVTL